MLLNMSMLVIWVATPCGLSPEDGGSTLHRNVSPHDVTTPSISVYPLYATRRRAPFVRSAPFNRVSPPVETHTQGADCSAV
jgi:hypothetical protein